MHSNTDMGWGPLGRGGIPEGKRAVSFTTDRIVLDDGSPKPVYFQYNGRGSLWLRRDREALGVKALMSRMLALCDKAHLLQKKSDDFFALAPEVWAERTEHGVFVYRRRHDSTYGNVVSRAYEEGFKPTSAQLAFGARYSRMERRMALCGEAWSAYSYLLLRALSTRKLTNHPTLPHPAQLVIVRDDSSDFMVTFSQGGGRHSGFAQAESPSWPWTSMRVVTVAS